MKYKEWMATVPQTIRGDAVWRMEVCRVSLFACDLAWPDVTKLFRDKRVFSVADQLLRSIGSVSANIAEGYSRSSRKDQARFYEYALGSAREARNWYYNARHVLGSEVANHRMELVTRCIKLLLTIIPEERGRVLREDSPEYRVPTEDVLDLSAPMSHEV